MDPQKWRKKLRILSGYSWKNVGLSGNPAILRNPQRFPGVGLTVVDEARDAMDEEVKKATSADNFQIHKYARSQNQLSCTSVFGSHACRWERGGYPDPKIGC